MRVSMRVSVRHAVQRWYLVGLPLVLALLGMLCYYPSLTYSFQFDDLSNIVKFYDIRHKTFGSLFFSGPRWISYWLNTVYYRYAQFEPFIYRLGNISAHLLTGILLFYVILLALSFLKKENFFKLHSFWLALCTAGFFIMHPVQTQTVSYVIQGQLEGLAGLGIMSMVLCFLLRARITRALFRGLVTLVLLVLTVITCGTKEIAIISPVLLLLVDWFFVAQGEWSELQKRWLLHGAIALIVGGIYCYFLKPRFFIDLLGFKLEMRNNVGNMLTQGAAETIKPFDYLLSEFKVILHYIAIFIVPVWLSVDYDWKLTAGFFELDCLVPFLILLALAWCIVRRLRRDRVDLISFGLLWFFVVILPRASIIPSMELVSDYKTYIASVGLLFVGAYYVLKFCVLLENLSSVFKSPALKTALIMIMLCCTGYLTAKRNTVWRTAEEFWSHIVNMKPQKARPYNNYGMVLTEKGLYREAIIYFKKALSFDPYYPDAYNNLAVAYHGIGELDLGIECLKTSISLQPYCPEGYNNLASYLIEQKNYDAAEAALHTALKFRRHYGKALYNLGRIYVERDQIQEACAYFKKCCTEADFDNELGFDAYGKTSLILGNYSDAIEAYSKILARNPDSYEANASLSYACLGNKEYDNVQVLCKKLVTRNPYNPHVLFTWAESLIPQGRYYEALQLYQKVTQLDCNKLVVYVRIAGCLDKLGRHDEALDYLDSVLDANPPEELRQSAQAARARLVHDTFTL